MRGRIGGAVLALSIVLAVSLSGDVAAETTSLSQGESFSETMTGSLGDFINYTWHGQITGGAFTGNIRFVVTDPNGAVVKNITDSSDVGAIWVSEEGTYTFTWTNLESFTVTLVYALELWEIGVGPEEALDAVLLALIIGAILVVVAVIVVVVLLLRGGRERSLGPASVGPVQSRPSGEAPAPYVPRMCPRCGGPIDSQHVFCPRCGVRVR